MGPLRRCSTKGEDNDANDKFRDCLAESEAASTSPTLGADQPTFRNGSISDSGIGSHFHRIVLEHYVEPGSNCRWSSRVVSARWRRAEVTDQTAKCHDFQVDARKVFENVVDRRRIGDNRGRICG